MNEITTGRDVTGEIIKNFRSQKFADATLLREKAISRFENLKLPGHKTEEYRFTPIAKNLEKNFDWSKSNSPSPLSSIDAFLVPGVAANIVTFINGVYAREHSKVVTPALQLTISPLKEALDLPAATRYFDKLVNSQADPFAALNTAVWQDGVFIHVPSGTTIDQPILVLHLNDASQSQVVAHTRLLAVIEQGSQLSIIEKFDTLGEAPAFHTFTEEIAVGESARLEYCKIQNDQGNSYQVANTLIHQDGGSHVNTFTLNLDGNLVRNNFNISIDGEKCESHFYGLYLLNSNSLADNHTVVDHRKPNSFSNEMYKGILDENAKGIFNGKIFVRPDAQKTNAFQSNRNILLTDTATINTKPQLEIWADDVKCSHGCTSGQLDEEALFYLQSRGIPKATAKAMLLYAFAKEILEPVTNESLKSYLDSLISNRLHQDF